MLSPTRSCSPRPYAGQCLSEDTHTGKGKIKRTYALEVLPICKDDLVWLPRATANSLGQPSQLALCSKVKDPPRARARHRPSFVLIAALYRLFTR